MPIYRIRCEECFETSDIFRRMSEYDELPSHCGKKMFRVICPVSVIGEITPYRSPATGKLIESRQQQQADLEKSGSIINEPGLSNDVARWKGETAEKAFSPIGKAIDATVTQLTGLGQIRS